MSRKAFYLAALLAVAVAALVIWRRNTPQHRAERFLNRAAEIATVTAQENEMVRRMKAARLRGLVGYEVHVGVEGMVQECDLMQDDVLAAWAYVVGTERYLTVEMRDVTVVAADGVKLVVNADIRIDSDYQRGAYSKIYPVVIELASIQRELRVSSIMTRPQGAE